MSNLPKREGLPMQHWGELRCQFRILNWLLGGESRRKVDFGETRRYIEELCSGEEVEGFPHKERLLEMAGHFEMAMNKYMFQNFIGARGAEVYAKRGMERVGWAMEFFRRHPEVVKPVEKPLIIVGLHRTGSSLLQRLLSLDPVANAMDLWKLAANPLTDSYETACQTANVDFTFEKISPSFQASLVDYHPMEPDLPDESVMVISPFFRLPEDHMLNMPFESEDVQQLMNDLQQHTDAFKFLRKWLQMWSTGANKLVKPHETEAGRHWVVKNPSHGYALDEMLEVFPDARLVFTHRKFEDALKSLAGLKTVIIAPMTEPSMFDANLTGRNAAEMERVLAKRTVDFVKSNPSRPDYHVTHKTLMADPIATIQDIYARFDMPFTEEYRQILTTHLKRDPPIPSKVNKSLTHYGLAPEDFAADPVVTEYNATFVNGK